MTLRAWTVVGVLWLVSLAAVGSITSAQALQPAVVRPGSGGAAEVDVLLVAQRLQVGDHLVRAGAAVHQHRRDAWDGAVDQDQRGQASQFGDHLVGLQR